MSRKRHSVDLIGDGKVTRTMSRKRHSVDLIGDDKVTRAMSRKRHSVDLGMVNVGGRSKGCSTCRSRRIKCGKFSTSEEPKLAIPDLNSPQDESQPVCRHCERYGFECTGTRDITFVQGKIVNSRRTEKRRNVATRYNPGNNNSADLQILPSVSMKGNEIEVYICYFREHRILRGGPVALALQQLQPKEVIPTGANTATRQIFPQAVVSFATVFFGAHHRQSQIISHGYTMFGVALKQLSQALSEPKCYTRDEVVLSVATLALLECWVPSGPKNYLKHVAGIERLLELRGPDPRSLELYKGLRHMILFASLRTRKLSILARAEWKTAFKINCSEKELQELDLYDVLADCTALVVEQDDMLATRGLDLMRDIRRHDEVKEKALTLLTHLHAWRKRWDSDGKNSYSGIFANEDDPPPFLTIFEFSSDSTATMLMFYNSALIYVLRILASLQLDSKDEYITAEWSAALDICRCIPYYLARESRLDLRVVHLAVVTVWTTFRVKKSCKGFMGGLIRLKVTTLMSNEGKTDSYQHRGTLHNKCHKEQADHRREDNPHVNTTISVRARAILVHIALYDAEKREVDPPWRRADKPGRQPSSAARIPARAKIDYHRRLDGAKRVIKLQGYIRATVEFTISTSAVHYPTLCHPVQLHLTTFCTPHECEGDFWYQARNLLRHKSFGYHVRDGFTGAFDDRRSRNHRRNSINGHSLEPTAKPSDTPTPPKVSILTRAWKALGITPLAIMFMVKGAVAPTITMAIYQKHSVAINYLNFGYVMIVVSITTVPILPRGQFVMNLMVTVFLTYLAAAMALLGQYPGLKARQVSLPTGAAPEPYGTYNSSASVVNAIFFMLCLFGATEAGSLRFVREVLYTFLIGQAILTAVSLLIIPISPREVFFAEATGMLSVFHSTANFPPNNVTLRVIKDPKFAGGRRAIRQLNLVLYMDFLLYSVAKSILELIRFAEARAEDSTIKGKRLMLPRSKTIFKWLKNLLFTSKSSPAENFDKYPEEFEIIRLRDSLKDAKDPEHLPPNT
ncbi:hypothetical protein G7Y89_g4321 [Cudoniella acicularis]|uniref:Zn(2)-C6 fungal-type domain-containing protein n=1 Tax=Cudoniella acicularis TaxID=354080 RepID=A0A8H4W545_9HELO|nr:hypothetical protein G7Y89_g4321 [Cudoniella acicularis]